MKCDGALVPAGYSCAGTTPFSMSVLNTQKYSFLLRRRVDVLDCRDGLKACCAVNLE